jgi:hypothetical protein
MPGDVQSQPQKRDGYYVGSCLAALQQRSENLSFKSQLTWQAYPRKRLERGSQVGRFGTADASGV